MYNIYISNYKNSSGDVVSTERLLYSVPITNSDLAFLEPTIKLEMGKTGSFEFSVNPVHPYYNAWCQMKTMMRVTYDGTTIFRGRVLTIDNTPLTGVKKIHLEGDLAFFMDSYYKGAKKDADQTKITCLEYLKKLINNHNSQMNLAGENYKKIYLGEVPGQYSSAIDPFQKITTDSRKYIESGWKRTADAMSTLQKEFGGYFRTRYVESEEKCYLDWLDYCFDKDVKNQAIEIKENLIDLSSTTDVDNLFTALIPIGSNKGEEVTIKDYKTDVHGKTNYILVPQIVSQFSDDELNKGFHSKVEYQNAVDNYGIIFRTQSFSNANTAKKLFTYALDYIKNNYIGGVNSFTISALDRHHIDSSMQKYLLGDQVWVIYPNINASTNGTMPVVQKKLVITSITYNLYNPEKNDYAVGIPYNTLNKTYGTPVNNTTGGKTNSTAAAANTGGGLKDQGDEIKLTVKEMDDMAWKYVVDGYYNNDKYNDLKKENPKAAQRAVNFSEAVVLRSIMDKEDPNHEYTGGTQASIQSIYIDGMNSKIQLAGYMPGWLAENTKDSIMKEMQLSESIVLDGFVGQWSIQDHFNYSEAEHMPIVWSDEMKAHYMTWKGVNAGPLFKISRDQQENAGGLLNTQMNMRFNALKNGVPSPDDPLGLTTRSYYGSIRGDGGSGNLFSFGNILGPDVDNKDMASIINDGLEGTSKYFNRLNLGDVPTAAIDALKGSLSNRQILVGLDGTGDKAVIDIDGLRSGISLKNVIDAGSTDPKTVTVDLTGADGALGLGKDDDGSNWIVTANKKITYSDVDEEGHIIIRVLEGGVHATDFHVNSVGSFATKFAAIDTLIAKKAFIEDLEADRARITDLEVTSGEMQSDLATIEGSALWTRRDNITGVVGEFEIKQDDEGKDILVIKSGGGLKINRNNVEYGIYDNGNLTGGIMVDKINDGTTTTKIKGNRVDIEAKQVKISGTNTVQSWMNSTDTWKNSTDETLDTYEGLIADRATIYQLNAAVARIATIETDYLNAEDVASGTLDVGVLGAGSIECGPIDAEGISCADISTTSVSCTFINDNDISNFIASASVSTDKKTLTLTTAGGKTVTFSKATSLSGTWSGGTLTVTPDIPQASSFTAALSTSGHWGTTAAGEDTKTYYGAISAKHNGKTTSYTTGAEFTVDANDIYEAGETAGKTAGKAAGWIEAYGKLSWPTASTSKTMTVKAPAATIASIPQQQEANYTVSVDSSYGYIKHGSITVARVSHSYKYTTTEYSKHYQDGYSKGYNAGWNALCTLLGATAADVEYTRYSGTWRGILYVAPTGGATPVSNCVSDTKSYKFTRR